MTDVHVVMKDHHPRTNKGCSRHNLGTSVRAHHSRHRGGIRRTDSRPTYVLRGLLVRILGECEALGEAAGPILELADDEDEAERERHPRRHVERSR